MTTQKVHKLDSKELEDLVKRYQANDQKASGLLYNQFKPLVCKIAHSTVNTKAFGEDAEDMGWEYFLQCLQQYKGTDYNGLPKYIQKYVDWLFRNARNKLYNHLPDDDIDNLKDEDIFRFASVEMDYGNVELLSNLERIIKQLPKLYQIIFWKIIFGDMPIPEFCEKYNFDRRKIQNAKHRTLKRLKKLISESELAVYLLEEQKMFLAY